VSSAARATAITGSQTTFRSDGAADRAMRGMLGVDATAPRKAEGAHRAFRASVAVSGVRCLITYLLVPVLVPMASLAGWVAAPIGIALCVYAVINGIVSLKRFWSADHPHRWLYTFFMAVVFVILTAALISDFSRLGGLT
jgi:hypothetical protein